MTKLARSMTIGCLSFGLLALAASSWAQTPPRVADQISKTYGIGSFDRIDAIRYTFNVEAQGLNLSRSWAWHPKTGEVSYEAKDKDGNPVKVTYSQAQLDKEPARVRDEIDPAFLNDQYNLLFPFHLSWDGAEVQDQGIQKLPLGKGSARRVAVKYSGDGGYTPGDTWELYVGSDHRVKEFAYHRAGPKPPKLVIMTWAGYKKAGPLLVATERRGTADGKPVRIFFTSVSVKLAGSDKWMNAH